MFRHVPASARIMSELKLGRRPRDRAGFEKIMQDNADYKHAPDKARAASEPHSSTERTLRGSCGASFCD